MNTAPRHARTEAGPSLYEAVATLARHFGGAFVHDRTRWGTHDGVIEYRAVYPYSEQVQRQQAAERLHLARATAMGRGGSAADQMAHADERVAHGIA